MSTKNKREKEMFPLASSYRYHNGKRFVGGTAALLHQIKQDGGLTPHYDRVIKKAIGELIEETNRQNVKQALKLVK